MVRCFYGSRSWPIVLAAAALTSSAVMAAEPAKPILLEAQPLNTALLSLANQSGVQIVFTSKLVEGRKAPPLKGDMTVDQALQRLLAGAPIIAERASPKLIVLRAQANLLTPLRATRAPAAVSNIALVQAGQDPAPSAPIYPEEPVELSEIVVGTHLRGGGKGASPVVFISRDDLDRGGYGTLTEAMGALPQTFGGAVSDDAGATGLDQTGVNGAWSSAINLRGLGADSTLVLVNGRRLAGAGAKGDFADISLIPLVAVERVEVLLDGASAIYGSDAVGGVVNVILRQDFEGAETRLRLGGTTRGDLGQGSIGQTLGKRWASGHALISVEAQTRDRLVARDRSYAGNADLRSLGGSDRRLFYSMPGTVVGFDPVLGLYPAYAIPAGQDGTALTPGDFAPGQNLENWREPYDVLPRQRRTSLYGAFGQEFGDKLSILGDLRWSERKFSARGLSGLDLLVVTPSNPYFVSPTGAPFERIAYSFQKELSGPWNTGSVESLAYTLQARLDLPKDWRLDAYGARARDEVNSSTTQTLNGALLYEALGLTPDSPDTAYSPAVDGYFNPYIGQGKNSQRVLDFINSGYDRRRTTGDVTTFNLQLDGPLFTLPAGEVRLAIGGQWRRESLDTTGMTFQSASVPIPGFTRQGEREVAAAFAEAKIPLFGPSHRRPGFERLELSAAGRYEHYDLGGSSAVPKLGLLWSPLEPVAIKATYGRSFRAPSLGELNDRFLIAPTFVPSGANNVLSLLLYGGNQDLRPEKATSWTAGLEYRPTALPGLRLEATLFETRFKDRISQPGIDYLSTVLTAADLAPFRQLVSPATNAADLAKVTDLINSPASVARGAYAVTDYGAIVDARYVNTAQLRVKGLDLTGGYGFARGRDQFDLQANLSWMMRYALKVAPLSASLERAGFAESPADLRLRASAAWTRETLSASLAVNHVGDTYEPATARRVHPWTTFDLQASWKIKPDDKPQASRQTVLSVTVQNLFDEDPPFYNSPIAIGYDPANADPQGRLVALQLTRSW